MARKIRSDAVLLNLPDERQEQIIEWCDTPKTELCPGGYQQARDQLAADGLNVSLRSLTDFYSQWHLRQDLALARRVEKEVALANPGDTKQARLAGEKMLLELSLAKRDPKLFSAAAGSIDQRRSLDLQEETGRTRARQKDKQLSQKDTDLKLAERRVAVLEKKFTDAQKTLSDPTLSMSEREARMKEMFGIS